MSQNHTEEAKRLAEVYAETIGEKLCDEEDAFVAASGTHAPFDISNTLNVETPVYRSVSQGKKIDFRIPGSNFSSMPTKSEIDTAWKDFLVSLTFTTENEKGKIQVEPEVYAEIGKFISAKNDYVAGFYEGAGKAIKDIESYTEYKIKDIRSFAEAATEQSSDCMESPETGRTYAYMIAETSGMYAVGAVLDRVADNLQAELDERNQKGHKKVELENTEH